VFKYWVSFWFDFDDFRAIFTVHKEGISFYGVNHRKEEEDEI